LDQSSSFLLKIAFSFCNNSNRSVCVGESGSYFILCSFFCWHMKWAAKQSLWLRARFSRAS